MPSAAAPQTAIVRVPGTFYDWFTQDGRARAEHLVAHSTYLSHEAETAAFTEIARALENALVTRHGKATVRHAELSADGLYVLNRMARVRAELNNGPGNPAHLRGAVTTMNRTADAYASLIGSS